MSIAVNQEILIKPHSQIYKDQYQSKVLAKKGNTIKIAMPYLLGKIILLGVGTTVDILDQQGTLLAVTTIVEKNHSNIPFLTMELSATATDSTQTSEKKCRVIAVTSGKGGVGKTNFTINLGISLAKHNQRVVIIDADLGTANIDVLMNLKPSFSLTDVINGDKKILDIIMEGPEGVQLIPGGSGIQTLANLGNNHLQKTTSKLQVLEQYADFLLIDTGAGLNNSVISFVVAADEVIVVTTPEPHAITDAYAIIKVMSEQDKNLTVSLVVNRAETSEEADKVAARMQSVVQKFLDMKLTYLGYIFDDAHVTKAVKSVTPYIIKYPQAAASKCINIIATTFIGSRSETKSSFFTKIRSLFSTSNS